MEEKFREATSLLINVGVFASQSNGDPGIPQNLSSPELLGELHSLGVEIVFYGSGGGDFASASGFGDLIEKNGHRVTGDHDYIRERLGEKDCVLLGSDLSDIDFFLSGVFSATPRSAPLDLRMVSNYVSNFDGEAVFTELGNLIVNSKSGG
jgi:hypothetical protein